MSVSVACTSAVELVYDMLIKNYKQALQTERGARQKLDQRTQNVRTLTIAGEFPVLYPTAFAGRGKIMWRPE